MAKNLDQLVREMFGDLQWVILQQRAQIEALQERIIVLEKPKDPA